MVSSRYGSLKIRNRRKSDRTPLDSEERPRALAVDDDPAYLRLLAKVLADVGFEAMVADSGQAALEILQDAEFDLVLLDLKMPGLDGFETFDQISHNREKPYCILITANDTLEIRVEAFDRGFDDFVSKQSNPMEIVAKLNAARRIVNIQRRLRDENSELMQLAMTDQLTGLSNRFYLFNRARELSASAKWIHVILFDLDHFKAVNDRHGHLAGDRILSDVAATMRNAIRTSDILARFGGDEFVLLLTDIDIAEANVVVDRILDAVRALRWNIGDEEISLSCSHGMASSEGRTKSLPELLSECDEKLYGAKQREAGTASREPAPGIPTLIPPRRTEPQL